MNYIQDCKTTEGQNLTQGEAYKSVLLNIQIQINITIAQLYVPI